MTANHRDAEKTEAAQIKFGLAHQAFTLVRGFTLDNLQVFSEWWICQFIDSSTGPFDFDAVDFCGSADSENLARIV